MSKLDQVVFITEDGHMLDHDCVSGLYAPLRHYAPEPAAPVRRVMTDDELRERPRYRTWQARQADEAGVPEFGPI